MATGMAVDNEGSVEKRMNMSLDDIIKETSKSRQGGPVRAKGIKVGGNRGRGASAGKTGRKLESQSGAGRVKVVPRNFAHRRQDTMAKRRGLQATGGQQARKALRPRAPIKKSGGRAPLRVPRTEPLRKNISNITVSIQNTKIGNRGQNGQRRPIIPTAADAAGPHQPRQQPRQQRYRQPLSYQQQRPPYAPHYGGGSRGGGLAPLGPSMMDTAPMDYRPVRRADPVGAEMPTYAEHDYRGGPPPNYEMEGGQRGMHADRDYGTSSRAPSLSAYTNTAERMHYTGNQRRNARGYLVA